MPGKMPYPILQALVDLLAGIDTRKLLSTVGGVKLQTFPDDEKRVQNLKKDLPSLQILILFVK
jgi:hypothetical protein